MIKRKTRQKLDAKYSEMNMNLENNYKDLAKTALKELDLLVEEMKSTGELNEKDYVKVRRDVDGYKTRLSDYHH
jgi:hypothetical protein